MRPFDEKIMMFHDLSRFRFRCNALKRKNVFANNLRLRDSEEEIKFNESEPDETSVCVDRLLFKAIMW